MMAQKILYNKYENFKKTWKLKMSQNLNPNFLLIPWADDSMNISIEMEKWISTVANCGELEVFSFQNSESFLPLMSCKFVA